MDDLRALVGHVNNPLLEVIKDAHANFSLWRKLKIAKTDKNTIRIMNRYVLFFGNALRSFLLTLIVSLYKLLDDKVKDTNNLRKLVSLARSQPNFSKETLDKLDELSLRAKTIWKKVRILRHKYFAHLEFNLDEEELWKKANITPDELEQLIHLCLEIFNTIRYEYGEGELPLISFDEDIDNLFSHLSKGNIEY